MQTTNSNEGWIYIMTNPSYSEVKIGKTTRAVEIRRKELSGGTGVPKPFEIFHTRFFQDCHQAEKDIHTYLDKDRPKNVDREFFSTSTFIAMQVVDRFYYEEKFKNYDNVIQNLNETIDNQQEEINDLKYKIDEQEDNITQLQNNTVESELKLDFWLPHLIHQNIFQNNYWWKEKTHSNQIRELVRQLSTCQEHYSNLICEKSSRLPNFMENTDLIKDGRYYSSIHNFLLEKSEVTYSEEQLENIMNDIFKNQYKCVQIATWEDPQIYLFEGMERGFLVISMVKCNYLGE